MKLRCANPFRIDLLPVFTHINTKVVRLFRDTEWQTAAAENSSDEQRSQCGQSLGIQNGLNLATDQGNPAVFSQNLSCRMTGDQLCTGKDSGQNRPTVPPALCTTKVSSESSKRSETLSCTELH